MVDYGTKATCSNCQQEFYMYINTHYWSERYVKGAIFLGGYCPQCSHPCSAKITDKSVKTYNNGESYYEEGE